MPCGKNSKAYSSGLFVALGGFLLGYHTGVISGVLMMKDFQMKMNIIKCLNDTCRSGDINTISGSIVGVLLFGCLLGSLIGGQTSDRFSRKYSISFFSFTFTIGVAIQTASFDLPTLLTGRVISGISIGALSMIVPIYHSEIATTKIRGRMITLQQVAITVGIAISFWINILTGITFQDKGSEWRMPFGLQMIPSCILAIGILFCPFSPRWLISHDREDEAKDVLSQIRSASRDEIEQEFNRIRKEVAYSRENEIESYHQLFRSPLLRPFLLGIGIQVLQQLTGINSTIYYAPRILMQYSSKTNYDGSFAELQNSFVVTGIYGCVNAVATIPTLIFIDKLGRRKLLISGAIIMSISMLAIAILDSIYEKPQSDDITYNNPIFIIISVFISIFIGAFALSWGPVPWIYCTEIFPLTMRAKATSLTTAANWATNCGISFLVPTLLYYLQYGLFIMFSILCAIMIGVVYLFYPETKGTHLEESNICERDRIFVPQWLEDRRRNYNSRHEQTIVTQENISNGINNYGTTAQRDDTILEKTIDPNDIGH